MNAENLLLGLTCQVTRTWPLYWCCGATPCAQLPGFAKQLSAPATVPSDTIVLAIGLSTVKSRSDPKNHALSFLIGPPCVKSVSLYFPIRSSDVTPWPARKAFMLLACKESLSYPSKSDPMKR